MDPLPPGIAKIFWNKDLGIKIFIPKDLIAKCLKQRT
jgi:hypothetical protein